MRIAQVIGTVTLSRCLPSFRCASLRLVQPMSLDNLRGQPCTADEIVVWDDLGAGQGGQIAVSEGAEAAQPFRPELKPVDAYNAAILDCVNMDGPDIS